MTGSSIARSPSSLAAAAAAGSAARDPDRTICWGELSFATASPWASASSSACSAAPAAEQREHPAVARPLAGLLHQPPAQHDELEPVALAQAAGGDERAELAERVPGHEVADPPPRAVPAPDRGPPGEARAEDRRLREVRALLGARERVLADQLLHERRGGPAARAATVSRMSGVWLPWPGNRIAVSAISSAFTRTHGRGYRDRTEFPPFGGSRWGASAAPVDPRGRAHRSRG